MSKLKELAGLCDALRKRCEVYNYEDNKTDWREYMLEYQAAKALPELLAIIAEMREALQEYYDNDRTSIKCAIVLVRIAAYDGGQT